MRPGVCHPGEKALYQLATAPRGIGQVLDSVFQLTRVTFVPLLPLALLTGLISAIPMFYMLTSGVLEDPEGLAGYMMSLGYWVSFLVTMPLSFMLYGSCILLSESTAQGNPFGTGKCIAFVARRLLTIILAFILFMLAVAIGTVLLVIPGLLLMVSLYLFLPAIVLDGKGAIESLKYSHGLVWGNWWRTAAIVTIAVIIIYVLMLLVGAAIGLALIVTGLTPATAFLIETGTSALATLVITPFFTALYVEVYRDLKMRKTGGDLASRIESAGTPG